jgi:4-amino-4-deoxy-L-arabinose transferase-like glycosyltransferase
MRIPRAALACALIAFLNAACWSLITPAFQVMNEPSHFAYVQYLAETGHLPSSSGQSYSPAEEVALEDLDQEQVRYSPQNPTISSAAQERGLEHDLALPLSRVSPDAGFAASEPPLYYALETIPYKVGSGGTILDSLALMRLFSALTAGATALFVFLFLREALPRAPWAWSVGALGVAFAPLLGLMSGAVNPDALLCALSAALFYCLARGFRRGLTPRLAALTGAVIAAGLLTKLNFLGLIPGAALGLLLLTVRARRVSRRNAYRSLAVALAVAAGPLCLYVIVNLLSGRHADGTVSSGLAATAAKGSILKEISYIWQFYLPRLPGMHAYFPGISTTRQLWIDGFVGLYGWVDTVFPAWVYNAALVPLALLGILIARALVVNRAALRRRLPELSVYAAIAAGVMILVGANDYFEYPGATGSYAQPRYLLPLIAIYGAGLALAARGAGRRWGPVAGVLIVGLLISHDVFSQLLEISRYYG